MARSKRASSGIREKLSETVSVFVPVQVSPDGVMTRDEKVFRFARERNIPLLMLTSGELDTFSSTFGSPFIVARQI